MSKTNSTKSHRLYWLLGLAALLVWLNVSTTKPVAIVAVSDHVTNTSAHFYAQPINSNLNANMAKPVEGAAQSLPVQLNRPLLEPALSDPFALLVPPAPPPKPPPVLPPPPPAAPPNNLTFVGRMKNPDGGESVFVMYGETSMAIAVGQVLSNGYRVDSITPHAIDLSYPALSTTAKVDLPAPPKYEIR